MSQFILYNKPLIGTVPPPPSGDGMWFIGPVYNELEEVGNFARATTVSGLLTAPPEPLTAGSGTIQRISVANGKVFFHRGTTACVSSDNGDTFTACDNSLWGGAWGWDVYWNGTKYYYGEVTSSNGLAWTAIPNLPSGARVQNARTSDGMITVQDNNGVFYTSIDNGANWVTKSDFGATYTARIATDGDKFMATSGGNFHYYSLDDLATASNPVTQNFACFGNFYSNGAWYVLKAQSGDGIANAYGIVRATDPALWPNAAVSANFTFIEDGVLLDSTFMAFDDAGVCVARQQAGGNCSIYSSSDNGVTWGLTGVRVDPVASIAHAASAPTDISAEILADSPWAYWRLDDSSGSALDSSGNARHMTTVTNVTRPVAGIVSPGTCYTFASSGSVSNVRGDSSDITADFDSTTAPISYVAVIKPSSLINQTVVHVGDVSINFHQGSFISIRADGSIRFQYMSGILGGYYFIDSAAGEIVAGNTYIIGVTFNQDSGIIQVFKNGVVVATDLSAPAASGYEGTKMAIGQLSNGVSTAEPWNGELQHVAVFNSVISASRHMAYATAAGLA